MSIQELIEEQEKDRAVFMKRLKEGEPEYAAIYCKARLEAIEALVPKLQTLQSEHKAEIVSAYDAAFIEGVHVANDNMPPLNYKSAEDYYQKTFTSEKFKK